VSRPAPPPDVLRQCVVYASPSDHPGRFVVREFWIRGSGDVYAFAAPLAVVPSLEEARDAIDRECPGLVCLMRDPNDDPVIVETWT
jgi:hypothetical protein